MISLKKCNLFFVSYKRCLKYLLVVNFLFLLVVPVNASGKTDSFSIVTTLTSNEAVGRLGLIGGVLFDENSQRLYVCDSSNKRILSYDSKFKYLDALQPGEGLNCPAGLVRTSNGKFIVVDPTKKSVMVIDTRKRSVKPLDSSKVPRADSFFPGRIAMDSADNIYIIDRANSRVLLFGPKLQFKREIVRDDTRVMSDVKVDRKGSIYTLSTIEGRVTKYDASGKKVLEFGKRGKDKGEFSFPVSLAIDGKGLIYVVDQHKSNVMVFDGKGKFLFDFSRFGWREGRLSFPSYIFINNSNKIFVVDRGNSRISIFR